MTYSNTYSSPSSPTNFNPFSGMGMRKGGRPSLFPGSGDGSTLNLDFTTGVLDPRLTFSRASTATFVNSSGYVEWAGANLCPYSQQINVGTWLVGATATLTPNTTDVLDPQGGNTATKIALGANAYNSRAMSLALPGGMTYTFSYWIRGTAGNQCRIYSNAGYVGDLVTETSYSYSTTEWTRVSTTFTTNVATTNVFLYVCAKQTFPATTDAIYVWGAQINPGSTAQTYYPTTTAAYHAPRFDYSPTNIGEPRGLLIEGQTQNVLYYSQDVTQATRWTIQGGIPSSYTSVSATGGTAPDNTNTANLCTESTTNVSRSIYQGLTAAAGTYTASVWVKAGTGSTRYIRLVLPSAAGNFVYVTVNISTGAVTQAAAAVGTASAASATVTPYPGSWYHIRLTGTLAAAVNFVFIVPLDSATPSVNTGDYGREAYVGNGSTFLIWGAQLEAGSGASSYIPTGASTVTRTPDLLAVTSTTTMGLNTSEGTFFVETELPRAGTTSPSQFGTPYANGSWLGQFYGAADATTLTANWWGGSGLSLPRSGNPKSLTALSYGLYTGTSIPVSSSLNGAVSTGTFTTSGANNAPNPATWSFITLACNSTSSSLGTTSRDNFNGCIKRFKYFPTRLSDAQLQTLTAP